MFNYNSYDHVDRTTISKGEYKTTFSGVYLGMIVYWDYNLDGYSENYVGVSLDYISVYILGVDAKMIYTEEVIDFNNAEYRIYA